MREIQEGLYHSLGLVASTVLFYLDDGTVLLNLGVELGGCCILA